MARAREGPPHVRSRPMTDGVVRPIAAREARAFLAFPRLRVHQVISVLLGGAVFTIGLDQYRPFLGSVGNCSDLLFGAAFVLGGVAWLVGRDAGRFNDMLQAVRTLEPVLWGGVLFTAGGVIASLGSTAPFESWLVTLKHFAMLCVWLP